LFSAKVSYTESHKTYEGGSGGSIVGVGIGVENSLQLAEMKRN